MGAHKLNSIISCCGSLGSRMITKSYIRHVHLKHNELTLQKSSVATERVVCYQISWCATSSVNDEVETKVAEVGGGIIDCENCG